MGFLTGRTELEKELVLNLARRLRTAKKSLCLFNSKPTKSLQDEWYIICLQDVVREAWNSLQHAKHIINKHNQKE